MTFLHAKLYMDIRVGKTGSLEPWSRVIVYWGIILAKGKLASIHYDSAPRPQRSCFAHPNGHSNV